MTKEISTEYETVKNYWRQVFLKMIEEKLITDLAELENLASKLINTMIDFLESSYRTTTCKGTLCLTSALDLESNVPLKFLGINEKPIKSIYRFAELSIDCLIEMEYNADEHEFAEFIHSNKGIVVKVKEA